MGFFYKEYLTIQDDIEIVRNLNIKYIPKNDVIIRPILIEEIYLDEIYFDPLKITINEKVTISPFKANIDGEIVTFYFSDKMNIGDMLYLTSIGIQKVSLMNQKKELNDLLQLYPFNNGKIYWIFAKHQDKKKRVIHSVLQC